jgi:hypothetical protein
MELDLERAAARIGSAPLIMLLMITLGCARERVTSQGPHPIPVQGKGSSGDRIAGRLLEPPDTTLPILTERQAYTLRRVYRPQEQLQPMGLPGRRGRDTVYVLAREEVTIVATFANRTASAVDLNRCSHTPGRPPSFVLEKKVEDRWLQAYAPTCVGAAIRSPSPDLVQPGGSFTDTLQIVHYVSGNTAPRFRVPEIPGTYRLVYFVDRVVDPSTTAGRASHREPLPTEARVSNEFRIEPCLATLESHTRTPSSCILLARPSP